MIEIDDKVAQELVDQLVKIEYLCEAPHWSNDHRNRRDTINAKACYVRGVLLRALAAKTPEKPDA